MILFTSGNLYAAVIDDVHKTIINNVNQVVVSILANKQLIENKPFVSRGIASKLTRSLLNPDILSQRLMGPEWHNMSESYRRIFKYSLMQYATEEVAKAIREHADKIVKHANELSISRVRFSKQKNRATVDIEIASFPKNLASFILKRNKTVHAWWITDIQLMGFSLMQNFRQSLKRQLEKENLDVVMYRMQSNTFK